MLEFARPAELHGSALEGEIRAAGWPAAQVSVAGWTHEVEVTPDDEDEDDTVP